MCDNCIDFDFFAFTIRSRRLRITFIFFTTKDTVALNFFSIVGLNLFFPNIATSRFADLYSVITIIVLYLLLLVLFHHRGKRG